jgi:hypothetical protein
MMRGDMVAAMIVSVIAVGVSADAPASEDSPAQNPSPLIRRYKPGETFKFKMTGKNQDRAASREYRATANCEVKQDSDGKFYEEVQWTDVVWNGKKVELPEASVKFRQILSLDGSRAFSMPDLSKVDSGLIGPILDLMTFYVDLMLASSQAGLRAAGDHVYFEHGAPNSWANPAGGILIGEDSIDFDMTLKALDQSKKTATLVVKHVPPRKPQIRLPAEWMKEPVADTPNNWVEVAKKGENKFVAAVGKETFDVELKIDLANGRIISATMDNPVQIVERECKDKDLADPKDPIRSRILRQIEITPVP